MGLHKRGEEVGGGVNSQQSATSTEHAHSESDSNDERVSHRSDSKISLYLRLVCNKNVGRLCSAVLAC